MSKKNSKTVSKKEGKKEKEARLISFLKSYLENPAPDFTKFETEREKAGFTESEIKRALLNFNLLDQNYNQIIKPFLENKYRFYEIKALDLIVYIKNHLGNKGKLPRYKPLFKKRPELKKEALYNYLVTKGIFPLEDKITLFNFLETRFTKEELYLLYTVLIEGKEISEEKLSKNLISFLSLIKSVSKTGSLKKEVLGEVISDKKALGLGACATCRLVKEPFVTYDEKKASNTEIYDVVFLGMNPYVDEIKEGKPFVGKAGKKLREIISRVEEEVGELNYLIYNVVPCFIPNNGDPTKEEVFKCGKELLEPFLKGIKFRNLVFLGKVAEFGAEFLYNLKGDEIRWKIVDLGDFKVTSVYHPSYVANYSKRKEEDTEKMVQHLVELLKTPRQEIKKEISFEEISQPLNRPFTVVKDYKTVIKLLKEEGYRPINAVKYLNEEGKESIVVKLKKDLNSPIVFYLTDDFPFTFYVLKDKQPKNYLPFQDEKETIPISIKYRKLLDEGPYKLLSKYNNYKDGKFKGWDKIEYAYGSDLALEDYVMLRLYEEVDFSFVNPQVFELAYYDIEVAAPVGSDIESTMGKFPITAITLIQGNKIYVMTHSEVYKSSLGDYEALIEKVAAEIKETFKEKGFDPGYTVIPLLFDSEKEMLEYFFNYTFLNTDILAAWNIFYDTNYVTARWSELTNGQPIPFQNFGAANYYYKHRAKLNQWPATTSFDLMEIYKAKERKEEYNLDFIAKDELGLGKIKYEGTLADLLQRDPYIFFLYNVQDTVLIHYLDERKGFSKLIIAEAVASHAPIESTINSTLAPIDCLLYKFARKEGKVLRNRLVYPEDFDKIGGFVREPNPEKENSEYVICYDVGSMYPNIIRTFNVSPDTMVGLIHTGQIKGVDDSKIDELLKLISTIVDGAEYYPEDYVLNLKIAPYTVNLDYKMTIKEFRNFLKEKNLILTPRGTFFKHPKEREGLFAKIVTYLLTERSVYKKRYKETGDPKDELLSTGIKILTNSLYGALGNSYFRFANVYLVETVTLTGQVLIKITTQRISEELEKTSQA